MSPPTATIPAYLIGKSLEVKEGFFHREDHVFEERNLNRPVEAIVVPSLFNSHAHLMDSIVIASKMPLEKLVGPGGYKFQVLSTAGDEELIKSNKEAIIHAINHGTTGLADFREMGVRGLRILKEADEFNAVLPLARPGNMEEAEIICREGFVRGFGMSSVRDHEFRFLEELRDYAKKNSLCFGIHAGERNDEDVEKAISLEPDFLIHMNQASVPNLRMAIDGDIPVISCFRSNFFFSLENRRNYSIMAESEKWGIGTDNAMIATPSILDEINFACYMIDPEKLFRAAFFGFELFGLEGKWILFRASTAGSKNPLYSIARGFCRQIMDVIDEVIIE